MGSVWTIRRSATDAKLAGLCGGVARHWGVDPVLVRVGAVLLAFSGGIGIVLYIAGWLLIPVDGRNSSTLEDLRGGAASNSAKKWPKEAWVAVVTVACVLTFAIFGSAMPFGFMPAVVLALIWYFGYYKNRAGRVGRTSVPPPGGGAPGIPAPPSSEPFRYPGPPTPFTQAAEVWRQRMEEIARQGEDGASPAAFASNVPTPPPPSAAHAQPPTVTSPYPIRTYPLYAEAPATADPRLADPPAEDDKAAFLATADPVGLYSEPVRPAAEVATAHSARSRPARRLRLMAIAALGLTLAGLGIADVSGASIGAAVYLGAALLVIGVALVAATWFGRARGILPVGLVLLLALLSVTVAQVPGQPGGFERSVNYTTLSAVPAGGDRHDVGALTIDLSRLTLTSSGTYTAHVDAGRLEVIAPSAGQVNVRVRYAVDAGVVVENGEPVQSGTEITGVLEPELVSASRPTLTLDLSADVGEIRVQR